MSHYTHSNRRQYNHNNNGRPRWRNNYNNNHNNWSPRRWRGRGRGYGRSRARNYRNNRDYHRNAPYQDISRMKLDDALPFHNDRYAPGGSEYERGGTATPASIRYMQYQTYSAAATPVYGLSDHESPSVDSYKHIEDEYKPYLHELNVDDHYPQLKYRVRNESDKKDVIHFGQLKLLLSEIRFLTEYNELGSIVVYAGAAPGHHIEYLSRLFPSHQFELYDPCAFSPKLDKHHKIHCHQQYFTNKLAKELRDKYNEEGILFISDIRTADHRQMQELENEECIVRDNEWQKDWCRAMKPRKAMLKFRLPYPDRIRGPTEYMDGQIWLQSFARRSGTETRLIPIEGDDYAYDTMKMYNHKQFEENLFFFNEKIRKVYVYNEFYDSAIGFENNFDCWSYGYLLERYLFYVVGMEVDETEDVFKKKKVLQMVHQISESLNINKDWFKTKHNRKSHYMDNYDMMDHRHFHDLNQKQKDKMDKEDTKDEDDEDDDIIPLPQKVASASRRNRKRSYREYMSEDRDTLQSLRYISSNSSKTCTDSLSVDPIGFVKKIAKSFPNPDAWKDKIMEMIGDYRKQLIAMDDDDHKRKENENVIDDLFKYLDIKNEKEREKEREDGGNDLAVLLCINRLFSVLCIQIPPNCGILNDSKCCNIYVMYGLFDASKITAAILNEDMHELYLFGMLSHKEEDITFKLVKIAGINGTFVAMNDLETSKYDDMICGIKAKLLTIDANLSFAV